MTQQGDDCYFYFYSTCAKGDNCLFRHCEAALGSETICTLWQEGRCFRQVCKFRHVEIDKRRSEIPCYWEKQPTGCTKLNCAFRHSMPRFIEGVFFPATKGVQTKQEVAEAAEEPMLPQLPVNPLQQPKIPIQSNPSLQVRGVMKLEATESVPSPTHPPVVINAADDDEDDDDQFSEEGEENKNTQPPTAEEQNGIRILSAKRQAFPVKKADDHLDFGIKTLEQIKQKKFMKEKMKEMVIDNPSVDLVAQAQNVEQNSENLVIEKENVRTIFRTVTLSPKKLNEAGPPFKRSLAERLGKKKVLPKVNPEDVPVKAENETAIKRNLSERLGKRKIMTEDDPEELAQKVQAPRSIRERLGLPAEVPTTENEKPVSKTEGSGEVRVKTLEEIRREKAAKRDQGDGNGDFKIGIHGLHKPTQASTLLEEATKIIRTVRVKTTAESLLKKQGQLLEETGKETLSIKHPEAAPRKEKSPGIGKGKVKSRKASPDEALTDPKPLEQVRIKTLEEIRREKALRRQENQESLSAPQESEKPKNETLPTRRKLLRTSKLAETVKLEKADIEPKDMQPMDVAAQGDTMETNKAMEANKPANGKDCPRFTNMQVKSFEEILKDKHLRRLQETAEQLSQTPLGEEAIVNKMNCEIQAAEQNYQPAASAEQKPINRLLAEQLPIKAEEKLAVTKPEVAEHPFALKVKPKLNVKPSFMKNSCPVRLSQKRKSPDSHPSSIMAVKPLNTVTTDLTKQTTAGKIITSTASPVQGEEVNSPTLQVPERSTERNANLAGQSKPTGTSETEIQNITPPQMPSKTWNLSSPASKTIPAEDDFEELMKEFSDDKLEAEIDLDPGKDEDDLLLELSEMIDS
ncbi:zinc finger CCCH domain-containing protein 11A isoform X1 [Scyliorhinus canicula]|uniref:zinc finger CCCH domain-containing protein 11A isoform X1 n=1 Tax=Scyliorhinus canicula TaxID=7830 RepID=UPI0018F4A30C|nr:zinc finger CCCH domain-containing protein 11A isoform X1 [Scyliorhinus canicula]XP_038676957.1 zinc finger CCCH domain-containing protein 11A isoform X1 [Scyliorhinus canicula]XP_038676958.1 zinc finger CCCH domain-containing protein 11A isoform X1 [Scyliorhinus canicula]